jgi:hypothetical protein
VGRTASEVIRDAIGELATEAQGGDGVSLWETRDYAVLRAIADSDDNDLLHGFLQLGGGQAGQRLGLQLSDEEIYTFVLVLRDADYLTGELTPENRRPRLLHQAPCRRHRTASARRVAIVRRPISGDARRIPRATCAVALARPNIPWAPLHWFRAAGDAAGARAGAVVGGAHSCSVGIPRFASTRASLSRRLVEKERRRTANQRVDKRALN